MAWGAISRRNKSRLLRINGNLNSERYINEVLDVEVLLLFYEQPNQIFQQDNARCHLSERSINWFDGNGVVLLP